MNARNWKVSAAVLGGMVLFFAAVQTTIANQPKNIIFFIGDGMGPEQVKAANYYNGGSLSFESFTHTGFLTTYSADSSVTDSAAAGTALATGYKVDNGVISIARPANVDYAYNSELPTMLEYFQDRDKSVGLVTSTYITHATPAAFGAHESSRNNLSNIASDYLTQTKPDIIFGGGANGMTSAAAVTAGYTVATDRVTMNAITDDGSTVPMVSGQFGTTHMPYEHDGDYSTLPHLSEMTEKALSLLDNDSDGFFLMVEGGRIDHSGHLSNSNLTLKTNRNIQETLEFSAAVQEAIDWASVRSDTLILVAADHETGGLTVNTDNGAGNLPGVTWGGESHTAANVPVYAWGVNSEMISGTMNNTDMFEVTVTPEPATMSLLALGGLSVLARRRRRS